MQGLELTLPTKTVVIKIGQSLSEVRSLLKSFETKSTFNSDSELNRLFLSYNDLGLEFIFLDESLGSLYLYLKDDIKAPFKGSFDCLDETFYEMPSIDKFYSKTISANYVKWFVEYSTGPVMVKGSSRLNFVDWSHRGVKAIVYSDCEPHLAKKVPEPFKGEELLDYMLNEFSKITDNYNVPVNLENIYMDNCRQLVKQIKDGLMRNL